MISFLKPRAVLQGSGNGSISPERRWKNHRTRLENTGKNWKIEAVLLPEVSGYFSVAFWQYRVKNSLENGHRSPESCYYSSGNCQNLPGKIRRLSGCNTASISRYFCRSLPAETSPCFLTWEYNFNSSTRFIEVDR